MTPATRRVVYVDPGYGSDTTGTGTVNNPFQTVDWALLHTTPADRVYHLITSELRRPRHRTLVLVPRRNLGVALQMWGLVAATLDRATALTGRRP